MKCRIGKEKINFWTWLNGRICKKCTKELLDSQEKFHKALTQKIKKGETKLEYGIRFHKNIEKIMEKTK